MKQMKKTHTYDTEHLVQMFLDHMVVVHEICRLRVQYQDIGQKKTWGCGFRRFALESVVLRLFNE